MIDIIPRRYLDLFMIARKTHWVKKSLYVGAGMLGGLLLVTLGMTISFEKMYRNRIYPGVYAGSVNLSGKTTNEASALLAENSKPYKNTSLTLSFQDFVSTISAEQLDVHYDNNLAAKQAFSVGRSGNFLADSWTKATSFIYGTNLFNFPHPLVKLSNSLTYNQTLIDEKIDYASSYINYEPIEPQFDLDPATNRVTTFRLGKNGRAVDEGGLREQIAKSVEENGGKHINLSVPVDPVFPNTDVSDPADLGIVELLATGESYFTDSISSRIYNIELASSRVTGVLVGPGEVFSFNDTIGDISAATGYKSAYVIKEGKTILDDGGGVCQVSTTVFRAALNAGLDIIERKPHSYRVSYYEQGGFKPGLDATVYPPYADLKIKNNTDNHILLTSEFDRTKQKLTYRIYGKSDGRSVYISDIRTWDYEAAPPPLYQEDPTLATGVIKQIEHATPGIKAAFDYKVEKDGVILSDKTITSNFIPWRPVYLYGPGTPVPES